MTKPVRKKSSRVSRSSSRATEQARLHEEQRQRVESLLNRPPLSYMDHPAFHLTGAAATLFDQAPPVPLPNFDWYRPGIEGEFDDRQPLPRPNTLLTAAQERILFLQFNFARFRAAELHRQLKAGRWNSGSAAELLSWHDRAVELRDRIVEFNLALVLAMARHVAAARLDFADLLSEGNMALLRAVDKFDVSRNFKFSTYACRAILKAFSRMSVHRSRRQGMSGGSFDLAIETIGVDARFERHAMSEYTTVLRRALDGDGASLTNLERQVLACRFPMEDDRSSDRPTLNEVGRQIGYSKERVRQIQQQALDKLRFYLENKFNEGPFEPIPD